MLEQGPAERSLSRQKDKKTGSKSAIPRCSPSYFQFLGSWSVYSVKKYLGEMLFEKRFLERINYRWVNGHDEDEKLRSSSSRYDEDCGERTM